MCVCACVCVWCAHMCLHTLSCAPVSRGITWTNYMFKRGTWHLMVPARVCAVRWLITVPLQCFPGSATRQTESGWWPGQVSGVVCDIIKRTVCRAPSRDFSCESHISWKHFSCLGPCIFLFLCSCLNYEKPARDIKMQLFFTWSTFHKTQGFSSGVDTSFPLILYLSSFCLFHLPNPSGSIAISTLTFCGSRLFVPPSDPLVPKNGTTVFTQNGRATFSLCLPILDSQAVSATAPTEGSQH